MKNPNFQKQITNIKAFAGFNISAKSNRFTYTNEFTNARIRFINGTYDGVLCEVWYKAELT